MNLEQAGSDVELVGGQRVGLTEKVTFESILVERERAIWLAGRRAFQAEEQQVQKPWGLQGTGRRRPSGRPERGTQRRRGGQRSRRALRATARIIVLL